MKPIPNFDRILYLVDHHGEPNCCPIKKCAVCDEILEARKAYAGKEGVKKNHHINKSKFRYLVIDEKGKEVEFLKKADVSRYIRTADKYVNQVINTGKSYMGVSEKPLTAIDQVLNRYFKSQWLELDNHINQTLLSTNYKNNPIVQMYQQVLNDTVSKTLGGLITPQKAFRSSIYDMVDKGIMSSFKDVSGREWSIERYTRMVIKTTTNKVFNDMRIERGHEYDIVTALMSSHAAARKACAPIQGGWVLTVKTEDAPPEFQHIKSIYDFGYGKPEGTQGIDCSHRMYVAVPGINKNNMPKPLSVEEAMKNAETVAKQRRLEVSVRKAKKSLNAAKELDNKGDIEHFNGIVRKRQSVLRQFIKDNDELLHRDYSREAVYS